MSDYNELHARRQKALADAHAIIEEGRKAGNSLSDLDYHKVNQLFAEADMAERQMADAIDGEGIDTSRRPGGADMAVRGDGRRVTRDALDEIETHALRPEQRFTDHLRRTRTVEERDLALGDYLRAMTLGARSDTEHRALSEGTDSAGGYTVPEILSAQMIDLLRARSVASRAGARTVPLSSDTNHTAKITADPTPAWRAEAGAVATSDPTFSRVTFAPKSLAVLVKASRELLEDSVNIRTELPRIITAAMALELDRVALFGSGTDPEPEGVVNVTGINTVAHNAALTSYAPFISARTEVLSDNVDGLSAFIIHPRDEGTLAGLTATDNQPLMPPPAIREVPFLTTTSVPGVNDSPANTQIVTGQFRHLLIGMRNEIRIEVLRERFSDNYLYGFLAVLRADIAVEHAAAFCKITGVQAS